MDSRLHAETASPASLAVGQGGVGAVDGSVFWGYTARYVMTYSKATPLASVLKQDQFVLLYHEKRLTIKEIAQKFETSVDAVTRLGRRYNVEPVRNQKSNAGMILPHRGRIEGVADPALLKSLYRDESLSMDEIAAKFGVTRKAVSRFFRKHGIHARSKTEARRLAVAEKKVPQIKYSVNVDYFRWWSQEMAWILGYIFAKGLVTYENKNHRKLLTIIHKNVALLEHIRAQLGSDHPILEDGHGQGARTCTNRYEVASVILVERLLAFGVTQNRQCREIKLAVPKACTRSFLRGLFEASGEVTTRYVGDDAFGEEDRVLVAAFRHPSEKLLNQVADMLRPMHLESASPPLQERNKTLFQLEYYAHDCIRLFEILYPSNRIFRKVDTMRRRYMKIMAGQRLGAYCKVSQADGLTTGTAQRLVNRTILKDGSWCNKNTTRI